MIRINQEERDAGWRALADELAASSAGSPSAQPPGPMLHEACRAVAAFCLEAFGTAPLPTEYLMLLVARCLREMGDERSADIVLARHCRAAVASCCQGGRLDGIALGVLWKMSSTGMFRPARWAVRPGEALWVLDLRALAAGGGCIELEWLTGLRSVLQAAAHVWDDTGGQGWLGLRGVPAETSAAGPRRKRNRGTPALATEMRAHCAGCLRALGRERRWPRHPEVLLLDL